MKLVVEPEAARWYKRELGLEDGEQLRVFVRLGGCGSVQPGLSLGIMKDESRSPGLRKEQEGLVFSWRRTSCGISTPRSFISSTTRRSGKRSSRCGTVR